MIDILDSLNQLEKKSTKEVINVSCVAFIQSDECHRLIEQAFRFEGIPLPSFVANNDEEIRSHVRQSNIDIALVELNTSESVTADMQHISHLLPNDASVIVIGQEDAISTIRNLKNMGFYYLFWPVTKVELIDFVKNVRDNRLRDKGLGKKRIAKQIAFWGCKGGIGTSMLVSEVAYQLSEMRKSKCLIVDHDYDAGNLDIFLKLEEFEKKVATIEGVGAELDDTYAMSMTRKISEMLFLLSITAGQHPEHEIKEFTRLLAGFLSEHFNFIIEDLSKGSQTLLDYGYLSSKSDTIVIVITPLVSAVRQAKKMLKMLSGVGHNTRRILVLNYIQPKQTALLSRSEIEEYLDAEIDVEVPYEAKSVQQVLDGTYLSKSHLGIAQSLVQLTALILGETLQPEKVSFKTRMLKKFKG
jgi:pilus assembly protein CpaE